MNLFLIRSGNFSTRTYFIIVSSWQVELFCPNVLLFRVLKYRRIFLFNITKCTEKYTDFVTFLEGRGKKNYKNIRKYYRAAWVKKASGKPLDK